jgi:hypothetical protein
MAVSLQRLTQRDFYYKRHQGARPTVLSSEGGPPTEAALHGPVVDGYGSLTLGRRLRPSARKLDQDLFLVFGFGLEDPTLRFLGILPELISL